MSMVSRNTRSSVAEKHLVPSTGANWHDASTGDALNLDQESTPFLYAQLRSAAIQGKILECREIVEYLMKERRQRPNLHLYNALILCNIDHRHGAAWRVTELLEEMRAEGLQPDLGTCHAVLKVVSVHVDHLLRSDILEFMRKRWYQLSADGAHDVAASLLREGLFEQALEQLDTMQNDGIKVNGWLWDIAVWILCEAEEVDQATKIMRMRYESGEMNLSRILWYFLLDKGSETRNHDATALVWKLQVVLGYINPPAGVCFNVLATASRAGDAALATEVFEHLGKLGEAFRPIHYELLISTYLSASPPDLERAISVLTIMPLERLEPSKIETRSLYNYLYENPARVEECFTVLKDLHAQGRRIPIAALNVLIECYVAHGNLSEAMKIYKLIHTFAPIAQGAQKTFANIDTFNLLLKGCRVTTPPDAEQASFLISELLALRISPNAITFDGLILIFVQAAAANLKVQAARLPPAETEVLSPESIPETALDRSKGLELLDWAFQHFLDMQTQGWTPRQRTFDRLAVALAREGDPRCWDVLQVAEDQNHKIGASDQRGNWMRDHVEAAWEKAVFNGVHRQTESDLTGPQTASASSYLNHPSSSTAAVSVVATPQV